MTPPFDTELEDLRSRSLLRVLREFRAHGDSWLQTSGAKVNNFASNDYLGLASHSKIAEAAKQAIDEFGVGSTASRLICGTLAPHARLEETLAAFKGTQSAISFTSGYAAALGTLPVIAGPNDVVILDKLAHACLIDAARLSRAVVRVFPHNHLGKLESHLQWAKREHPEARVVIVTESIFSMDGDRAALDAIVALKQKYDAVLLLDEAHAVGVIGPKGRGLAEEMGLAAEVDIQMGTLSKAVGASGGYICGSRALVQLLVNRARSFIFSTAPPPMAAAAAKAGLELIQSEEGDALREKLWSNIRAFCAKLPASAPVENQQSSAILPWIVGAERDAVDASRFLFERGQFVPAIRYPTVAKGTARLRISLSAAHTPEQLTELAGALADWHRGSRPKPPAQQTAKPKEPPAVWTSAPATAP